jgi:predicted HAD superfamily Cof-like phosphohydrolase
MGAMKTVRLALVLDVSEGTTDQEAAQMVERSIRQQQGYRHSPVAFPASSREHADVFAFHRKFQVPMAAEPSLLDPVAFDYRQKFLQEEVNEVEQAHAQGDVRAVARELMDVSWMAIGTALMMGVPWTACWQELVRANMDRVRASSAGDHRSKRHNSMDVVKPPNWREPDFTLFMGKGPWPTFQTGAVGIDLAEAELRLAAEGFYAQGSALFPDGD